MKRRITTCFKLNDKEKEQEQSKKTTKIKIQNQIKKRRCTSSYLEEVENLNKIGQGTYGHVYRAQHKKSGEIVAIKKVEEKTRLLHILMSEIKIQASMNHPSIVKLKHSVVEKSSDNKKSTVLLVMEYAENNVRSLLEAMKHPFNQSEVKCLMQQLLLGVEYIHANRVIHRDLKTANLLLNNRGELKICDFGLAFKVDDDGCSVQNTETVVSLWYRAPELLLGATSYFTEIDMWSVGCIMAELISGQILFEGRTVSDQLGKMFEILGRPNEDIGSNRRTLWQRISSSTLLPAVSNAGYDLLSRLLTYDPMKRITAKEALNHDWFRQVPLPKSKDFMPTFPPNYVRRE